MIKEKKKILKMHFADLSLVVGGIGAFTLGFKDNYVSWNATSQATTGFSYTNGINKATGGHCLAVTKTSTGLLKAGWDFANGFPTRAWADTYGGGSAVFRSAFYILYGSANWPGWGAQSTF